jgi:hypothetical protein
LRGLSGLVLAGTHTGDVSKPETERCAGSSMPKNHVAIMAFAFLVPVVMPGATLLAPAQAEKSPYPAMAPVDAYLIPDQNSEIALARTGAPASISDGAAVMVLGGKGYTTAAKGTNGFLCVVERSWGAATDDPEFWNPKIRSPICFNPAAARTFAQIYLMKTQLVLAGKSKTEIVAATAAALDKRELPALEPGSMCYMMSKQQHLNDRDMSWHPHLMFLLRATRRKAGAPMWMAPRLSRPMTPRNGSRFLWSRFGSGRTERRGRRSSTDPIQAPWCGCAPTLRGRVWRAFA